MGTASTADSKPKATGKESLEQAVGRVRRKRVDMVGAALRYADDGYPVVPLNGKQIIGSVSDATTKARRIREWGKDPHVTGFGLATGHGFFVLDLMIESFGWDIPLHELEEQGFLPPGGLTVKTPSGGIHCYLGLPAGVEIDSSDEILPGVKLRGADGYVVIPETDGYKILHQGKPGAVMASQELLEHHASRIKAGLRERFPDLMKRDIPLAKYLVADLIPAGSLGMVVGKPGSGKSTVLQSIAIAVSRGAEWMGRKTIETPVFVFDRENPDTVAQAALKRLGCQTGDNLFYCGRWLKDGVPDLDAIGTAVPIARLRPLIIFDSFTRFHTGSENDASEVRETMEHLRRLTSRGATVIYIHHTGKDKSGARGSVDIEAASDWVYEVTPKKDNEHYLTGVTLECTRFRYPCDQKLELIANRSGDFTLPAKGGESKPLAAPEYMSHLERILKSAGEQGYGTREFLAAVSREVSVGKQKVYDWLQIKIETAKVRKVTEGKRVCYSWVF